MKTHHQNREVTALNWLLRLPLLGAYDLSLLLDEHEDDSLQVLQDFMHKSWLCADTAASPELEPERLFWLSDWALRAVAGAMGLPVPELTLCLPVGSKETDLRWKRVETTVGVNRVIAEIVASCQKGRALEIEDVLVLPQRRVRTAWWPDEVEAYVCLRSGDSYAPCFIAWDRAGAPRFHRQKRVAAWARFRSGDQAWGFDACPPVLVLCSDDAKSTQWKGAFEASAERRREPPLPCLVTEIDTVFSASPLEAFWQRAGSAMDMTLVDGLLWRSRLPAEPRVPELTSLPPLPGQLVLSSLDTDAKGGHGRLQLLGVTEKRVLDWLAFHPLLTDDDIATLIRARAYQVRTVIANLSARGLIDHVARSIGEKEVQERFYFLSRDGVSFLAVRDGVPLRRYVRFGSVAAAVPGWRGEGRFETLLREFEHTVGINHFFVPLIANAQNGSSRVTRWLSASNSTTAFTYGGTTRWLRPDGVADLQTPTGNRRVMLEWDRGTVRPVRLREKWLLYAEYFSCLLTAGVRVAAMPRLLVVTTTSQREKQIWQMVEAAFDAAGVPPALCSTTLIPLVERYGPWSSIWKSGSSVERRPMATDSVLPDAPNVVYSETAVQRTAVQITEGRR